MVRGEGIGVRLFLSYLGGFVLPYFHKLDQTIVALFWDVEWEWDGLQVLF